MIGNEYEDEILDSTEILNEEKSEQVVDSINSLENGGAIESLDDISIFTPVASDGIQEEEILLMDENNLKEKEEELLVNNVDDIIDNDIESVNEGVRENDNPLIFDDSEKDSVKNDVFESSEDLSLKDNNVQNETNDNVQDVKEVEKDPDFTNLDILDNNLISSEKDETVQLNEINEKQETEKVSKEIDNKNDSLLEKYGENFSIKEYICNPAIGRDDEIKQLILTLLTPEKSGILVGKPGIGKTAIVEGLGYQIQKGNVPDALKGYQIYKLNTASLLGIMPGTNEPKIQVLLTEIKDKEKLILFIDEIHTLIGAGAEGDDSLDFANIFKPGLDRGNIKIIGATTSDEYDKYILTDKAFVRRFQKIEVLEPTKEHTVKIMMGSLPKLEKTTGAKLKYTSFVQEKIMTFIVDLTSEYRRVYELSARYPDVALSILQQAFSYAVFDNKSEVGIRDVRKAINNTKLVYPDVIKKELVRFNDVFSDIYLMETPQRLKGETNV